METQFNAHYHWLGIPPEDQPCSHYRLLGIRDFEASADVIENAADRHLAHLRNFQIGPRQADALLLMQEVTLAKLCLLEHGRKAKYDSDLRHQLLGRNTPYCHPPGQDGFPPNSLNPTSAIAGTRVANFAQPYIPTPPPAAVAPRPSYASTPSKSLAVESTTTREIQSIFRKAKREHDMQLQAQPRYRISTRQKVVLAGLAVAGSFALLVGIVLYPAMTAAKPELVATGQLELDWNHSRFSGGQLLVDGVPTKAHQLPNGHLQISGEVGKSIRVVAKRACFQEVEWLFRPAENRVTHWREPTWNPRATLNLNWSKKDRSLAKFNDNNAATFVQAPTRQSPPVFLSATGGSVRYAVEPGSFQVRIRDASPDYAYKEFRKNVTLAAGEIASVDFVPAFKDVTQHGLAAEVFEATDIDLEKHHHTTVMHPAISDGSILVGTDYVSVRFRGYLKVRDAGDYCLHVEVDDTVAISLDGICIYDSQRETGKTARVSLTGRPQELQIDFRDTGGPELLQIKLHRLRSAAGGPLDAADAVELPPEALFVDFAYADKRPGAVIPTKPKNVTAEN